ncbi:hypothetical protein QF030_000743 [Streptomyces rishiriensis]|uniref:Uncharacterized protein n=1 Tax=Streptomyces rishiriensis TaxID=68264 RepID=A0ABU0NHM0_STRRH|nr:hypothetical protein [Streptomyces rishiriensis]
MSTVRKWRGRFAACGAGRPSSCRTVGTAEDLRASGAHGDRGHRDERAAAPGSDLVTSGHRATGGRHVLRVSVCFPGRPDAGGSGPEAAQGRRLAHPPGHPPTSGSGPPTCVLSIWNRLRGQSCSRSTKKTAIAARSRRYPGRPERPGKRWSWASAPAARRSRSMPVTVIWPASGGVPSVATKHDASSPTTCAPAPTAAPTPSSASPTYPAAPPPPPRPPSTVRRKDSDAMSTPPPPVADPDPSAFVCLGSQDGPCATCQRKTHKPAASATPYGYCAYATTCTRRQLTTSQAGHSSRWMGRPCPSSCGATALMMRSPRQREHCGPVGEPEQPPCSGRGPPPKTR